MMNKCQLIAEVLMFKVLKVFETTLEVMWYLYNGQGRVWMKTYLL